MTEEQPKTVESETAPPAAEPVPVPVPVPEAPKDVAEEKSVIPVPSSDDKPDESKALVLVESKIFLCLILLMLSCFGLVQTNIVLS